VGFSIVIALIASLDRPQSGFITVSQQPMFDARAFMGESPTGAAAPTAPKK
jgi:ABC-type sulfate/molybdate transport systems ATPase subunit